jgi:hypothetical protein
MAGRAKQVVARSGFVTELDGKTVVVVNGSRFAAGDPLVKANPERFEPVAPRRGRKR